MNFRKKLAAYWNYFVITDNTKGQLCQRFNETYNASLKPGHILEYDLTSFIGEEGKKIFITRGFFKTLRPFPHAAKVINRLQEEGCEINIASDSKSSQIVEEDKLYWVRKYLPFYPTQKVIFTTENNLLSGDLIFDDSPDVINKFPGIKVAMDRPLWIYYFKNFNYVSRVSTPWQSFNLIEL